MPRDTAFTIDCPEIAPGQTLLVGLASPGMASLTAATHIVEEHEATEIGHVAPAELPAITPFEDGTPRHHTRLYDIDGESIVVLLSELFVPPWAARPFVEEVLDWATDSQIAEIAMLHPVAYEHAPDDHQVFYVATEEYETERLDGDVPPMSGGVLDGVPSEFLSHSLRGEGPPTGIYVTPAHPPGPDIDGALLFLDAVESTYDLDIDRSELEDFSREIKQHYETLAERMATLDEAEQSRDDREFYADRMYM
ncbi:proteasome assembly chaperone family protein [Halovenus sp. WSH3]|uniref:Proteasome assembly chaperone family protein n=1 Tax=Halovenus carboxidivorans TaxID=2692199 RepID=A0A6B0TA76_9EURY|nr:PAC2 family protein [Halovenus carboxidivorans]MXR52141.1 proteasome assembly chaperone family protein [Halovenus carboxidivorans]